MPVRDLYHENVKQALMKDGWAITHDPLRVAWGGKDMCLPQSEEVVGWIT